jgi:RNA polymerase sigma factor (TIGR02999 family)
VGLVPAAEGEQPELNANHRQLLDDLFSAAYRELRRMAASIKRADAKATISTETLVHETWMKLARSGTLAPKSELHLKHIVAQAMRQYLIETARQRCAAKRGGGAAAFITLDDSVDLPVSCDRDLLALDSALEELTRVNPRSASLIELRFFGGLDVAEAAGLLGIAESTALRDWRTAKAWLSSQIRRGQ